MDKRVKILRWVTAAASVLLLLTLAWMCLSIYIEGNSPANLSESGVHLSPVFSREKVGEKLGPMLPAFIVYVILVVFTAFSGNAGRSKAELSAENRLRLMKVRLAELPEAAAQEEKKRTKLRIAVAAALVILAVPCLIYLLNGDNFASWDLEQVVGSLMLAVAPWVVLGFALVIIADVFIKKSIEREMEIIKAQGVKGEKKAEAAPVKKDMSGIIRLALLVLAVLFIVLGVNNGGLRDVLVKAVNICTECIGLG